jgi:hypothetical protein
MNFTELNDLIEEIRLLRRIAQAAKLVVPTSDDCPLMPLVEDYHWFLDVRKRSEEK